MNNKLQLFTWSRYQIQLDEQLGQQLGDTVWDQFDKEIIYRLRGQFLASPCIALQSQIRDKLYE